jgi:transposase
MYVKKSRESQKQIKFLCIEDLVPENHLVRDIDRAIDFIFIYKKVNGTWLTPV